MIRIGICDDLVEQLQIQEEMVRNIVCRLGLNTEIKCFQSGEDLLWEMEQKGNMDIILLDIEMGGINGVETARRIREKDNRAILFFISYYEQYCKEIINVQPFRFIDKPVSEEELDRGFREAFKAMSQKEEIFEYTYKKVPYKILVNKIRYFESDKRQVNLYSTDGVSSFYKKLDEVEAQLEQMNIKFLRISKSYLVNVKFDRVPEQHATKAGFMSGFEKEFLDCIQPIKVVTALNTVSDKADGETEVTYDTFFLPALEQMYINPQLAGEGDVWEYWKRASGMSTKMQQWQTYPQIRTYAIESHTSAQYVRLRSAYRDTACNTWYVGSSGHVSSHTAVNALRCAPVCVIC